MFILNEEKTFPFVSTIAMESMRRLFEDEHLMTGMLRKFKGSYFNEIRYHIMEYCGDPTFMLYHNDDENKHPGNTLHAIFCVDPNCDQIAKTMIEGTYKRFMKAVHENSYGNFGIDLNAFSESLSNMEENEGSFRHQHPLLDVIDNIWAEEENDDNREEGKII